MHWFDELTRRIDAALTSKSPTVCNGGLSVSGLQHVGGLRGEIVLNHFLATHLRAQGRTVTQHLVLYTQDPWKGTAGQRAQFPAGEGDEFVGRRLIDVPDPQDCHDNWVEHYWAEFGESLDQFAPDVEVTRTTDLYQQEGMQRWVKDLIGRAEAIRPIVNRYRPRNPHPTGWLPFEPYCPVCQRIGHGRSLRLEGETVAYECECGEEGTSSLELGKLNWRLEWPVLWALLGVDIEPFGKDHAAPGGSRESCQVIAEEILGIQAPFGIPYEWVGYAEYGNDLGDMEGSGFLGFDSEVWLRVAGPEVLRYLFAQTPIRRRMVLDLSRVDAYHGQYDLAETAFFASDPEDAARSYALAQLDTPPPEAPYQLGYRTAALLAQVAPAADRIAWALQRLQESGLLKGPLPTQVERQVGQRLERARQWVGEYGPEDQRVTLLDKLPAEVRQDLTEEERNSLALLRTRLEAAPWTEAAVKEAMVDLTESGELPLPTKRFFAALYRVFLGQASGPRAAPLLVVLERDFVLERLREAST